MDLTIEERTAYPHLEYCMWFCVLLPNQVWWDAGLASGNSQTPTQLLVLSLPPMGWGKKMKNITVVHKMDQLSEN